MKRKRTEYEEFVRSRFRAKPMSILRYLQECEVMLEFFNSDSADLFKEWYRAEGEKAFIAWLERDDTLLVKERDEDRDEER